MTREPKFKQEEKSTVDSSGWQRSIKQAVDRKFHCGGTWLIFDYKVVTIDEDIVTMNAKHADV